MTAHLTDTIMEKSKRSSRERKKKQKKKALDEHMKLQMTYDACKRVTRRKNDIKIVSEVNGDDVHN